MARKMPQNLEAEMSVLGVAFLDDKLISKIVEEVNEDMFYDDRNKKLFQAIKSLHEQSIAVDVTTVSNELDKTKNFSAVGGIEYLTEVIDSVATAANLDYYINIIKEKAIVRNLINTATDIVTEAYEEEDNVTSLLDTAEKNILDVVRSRQTSEFVPISEALRSAQEQLEYLAQNKSTISGLETGFIDLDKATSGLHEGEMIVIAARPGMGKTAFALNIATHAAMTTKKAIAIFNLEMSKEQLVNRMLSALGGIEGKKLQNGQMMQTDWKKYNEAMSQLADTNMYIEDNAGITSSDIRAKCRRLASKPEGLGLVIIDYLQLLTLGGKRPDSRQQEVSDISRSIKTMAMELKVPVIALAQLSRNAEKRENNEPMLADLRESGSIEQDADIVMFINRKDYYKAKEQLGKNDNAETDIIIAKHRKGGTGKFTVLFEPTMMNFKNYISIKEEGEY
ncbi:MAG: replicative DNA helicase [Bacilli bacterium]|nr:replicative DNA helicase [Bacilli bacterium]